MAIPEESGRIERVLAGDRAAFLALYDEHLPGLWRLATRLCDDRAAAEALTAAVLRHAFRSLADGPLELSFAEWLAVLAVAAARSAPAPRGREDQASSAW